MFAVHIIRNVNNLCVYVFFSHDVHPLNGLYSCPLRLDSHFEAL